MGPDLQMRKSYKKELTNYIFALLLLVTFADLPREDPLAPSAPEVFMVICSAAGPLSLMGLGIR